MVAIALVGATGSVLVWLALERAERVRIDRDFQIRAQDLEFSISRQIETALLRLEAIVGFQNGSRRVERAEFENFTAPMLTNSPSTAALEWVPRVRHADREAFEQAARDDGLAQFQFTQQGDAGTMVRREDAEFYFPVFYVAPLLGNLNAIGFDLASEPMRRAALEQAMRSGRPVATAPITLVQASGRERAILIFRPVYEARKTPLNSDSAREEALLGFALGVFRVASLVEAAVSGLDYQGIDIQIVDANQPQVSQLILHLGDLPEGDSSRQVGPTRVAVPLMPGLAWRIESRQTPEFSAARRGRAPWFFLLSGLGSTALLAALFGVVVRHERMAADRRFQQVVEAIPHAVLVVDGEGVIELVNQACEPLFGCSPQQLLGQSLTTFIPGVARRGQFAGQADVPNKDAGQELFAKRNDGQLIPIETVFGPVDTLVGMRFVAVVTDITRRKLARESGEKYKRELERSNRELRDFAYVASHDLKEPLRVVSSYGNLLADRLGDKLDSKVQRYLDHMQSATARMRRLIDDLLQYSRAGSASGAFAPIDLAGAVAEALGNLEVAIRDSGAEVTCADDPPSVLADRGQLVQLLQNLVANSIKFCKTKPRIEIGARPEGDFWEISVSDNGPGIQPENLDRIFNIFERLESDREIDGTGIGLAICRRIVQRHGGQIRVESEFGQGACFRFTLPKANGEASKPA